MRKHFPLSPFFIILADTLGILNKEAREGNRNSTISISLESSFSTHQHFVDDMFLLRAASVREAKQFIKILSRFEDGLSQSINKEKASFFPYYKLDTKMKHFEGYTFKYVILSKYLGFHLSSTRHSRKDMGN